jgi:DNA gyrase subunit B
MPMAKLMNSKPVQNVLAAMGYNHQATDVYAHFRVQRLYLLADADPDGSHINALILTVVWRLFPKLIEEGRVFICNAPLFSAFYKGKQYFGKTHEECHSKMPKGTPKDVITRAKGWGELAPETLEVIAFHPDTRNVIKVLPPRDVDEKNHFLAVMGSDSLARKELLGL